MSKRAKIIASTIGIIFFIIVAWVIKTTPDMPVQKNSIIPPSFIEYDGNTIKEEKDGLLIWELTCDKMNVDVETQNVELIGVKGKFYQHDEKEIVWNLTAVHGVYFKNDKFIVIENNVKVTNTDNSELLADKLEWFYDEGKFHAIDNVRITYEDRTKMRGDKIEWLTNDDKIIATGNVRIARDDMRAYGDLAYAHDDFKKFGLVGNAKILKGIQIEDDIFIQ